MAQLRFTARRRIVFEFNPLHRPSKRLDTQHDFTVLKKPHRPVGFADDDGHGLGSARNRGRCPVPRAEPFAERNVGVGGPDDLAGFFDGSVNGDEKRAIQLGDFLDRFSRAPIEMGIKS